MLSDTLAARGLTWPWLALLGALLLGGLGPLVIDVEGNLPLSLQSLLVCWIPLLHSTKVRLLSDFLASLHICVIRCSNSGGVS